MQKDSDLKKINSVKRQSPLYVVMGSGLPVPGEYISANRAATLVSHFLDGCTTTQPLFNLTI